MGQLLKVCRPYLLLLANQELDGKLQRKVGASDVVQDTLLQIRDDLGQFRGENQQQLFSWLRQILLNELADTRRRYVDAKKRNVRREEPLGSDSIVSRQSPKVRSQLTPSSEATAREESEALSRALEKMSPEDREVIKLRSWDQLSWDDVAKQTNRSPDASRKLWGRAVERLKVLLESGGRR